MIELREIRKIFNINRPDELVALDGINLNLNGNEATVFRGPSGSGKTTLLSIIGCMARPTAGRVFVTGQEITSLPERFLTQIRRKTFGFIFQQFHLIRGISVLENVMLPAYTSGEKYESLRQRALTLLDNLGLDKRAESKVEWLSGGEAQRVVIARALINNPSIIIADEPTAHLDTKLSADFMEAMAALKKDGRTVLFASHDPLVCESAMVDMIVEMRDGKIISAGGAS